MSSCITVIKVTFAALFLEYYNAVLFRPLKYEARSFAIHVCPILPINSLDKNGHSSSKTHTPAAFFDEYVFFFLLPSTYRIL